MRSYDSSLAISGKVFLENERGPSMRVGLCRLVSPCLEVSDSVGLLQELSCNQEVPGWPLSNA